MRILLVSEDLPAPQVGGLGKHAVRLGNALIEKGHAVTLMGRSDIDYAPCAAEVGFHGPFIAGFDFRGAGWKEHALGVFLPYKRPHIAKRIARAILARARDFDVVHYHGHLPLVGRYIPPQVNFVQTRHDQGSECIISVRFRDGAPCTASDARTCAACAGAHPNALQRAVSAAAVRQYRRRNAAAFARHKTIFVSEFLRRRLDAVLPLGGSRSFVIHNFIDLKALPPPASVQGAPPADAKRIVIAARIDAMKGVEAFLQALAHRPTGGLEIEILGDGPLRLRAEQAFASSSVRFLGWCSQARTLAHLARADLVVVPSLWDEPCASTILEGLALGKRVLALARGGTPELRRYERWPGQLALFGSLQGLVAALLEERPAARHAAREFRADVSLMLPQILTVYEQRSRA